MSSLFFQKGVGTNYANKHPQLIGMHTWGGGGLFKVNVLPS